MLHENSQVALIEAEAIGILKDIQHRLGDFAELMQEKIEIMCELDEQSSPIDMAREQTLFFSVRRIHKLTGDLIDFMNYDASELDKMTREAIEQKERAESGDIGQLLELLKMIDKSR